MLYHELRLSKINEQQHLKPFLKPVLMLYLSFEEWKKKIVQLI